MRIERTHSTNSLMKEMLAKGEWPKGERFLYAGYQTAGRGQTGNGWESEADKNLLCSILIDISRWPLAVSPFYLNVLVSVAVHKAVMGYGLRVTGYGLPVTGDKELTIKWPNDIYWEDKKLAGILIEGAIEGGVMQYAVAGIGLNVNQTEWHSDAPNPVSLKQIMGSDLDIDDLMARLMEEFDVCLGKTADEVWAYYKAHLYRKEGWHLYAEREVSVTPSRVLTGRPANLFMAQIKEVTEQGELVLQTSEGTKKYHFKQIQFVL